MKIWSHVLPLVFATALLAGCAAPARIDEMSLSGERISTLSAASSENLKNSMTVRDVSGGKETNPMWMSQVGTSEFERALEGSLKAVGLLSDNRYAAQYGVIADLAKVD